MAKSISNYSTVELQEYLTTNGIEFAPEAKYADLKTIALEHKRATEELAHIEEVKAELTASGIEFAPEATLEELEALLPAPTAPEVVVVNEDGFVKVRNESSRIINGLHPWQIKEIKEENLSLYESYGCVLFTGLPKEETAEVVAPVEEKEIPPHQR